MKTILLIEDQADMRDNIATILEMEGYEVLQAANGEEGISAAKDHKPDLILCDVMMPVLDGHAVLTALRADKTICGTPFIYLTAKGEKQDLRQGMNLGADDYITKPVGATELLSAVRARLAREQSRISKFAPNFSSSTPLETLGMTPREAEVLLWIAQGKSNSEAASILGCAENTVKVHLCRIFEKIGADNRHAAMLIALELLSQG